METGGERNHNQAIPWLRVIGRHDGPPFGGMPGGMTGDYSGLPMGGRGGVRC